MGAWIIFCVVIGLSFIVPGGIFFVLFWGLILTPLWLLIGLVVAFFQSLSGK